MAATIFMACFVDSRLRSSLTDCSRLQLEAVLAALTQELDAGRERWREVPEAFTRLYLSNRKMAV